MDKEIPELFVKIRAAAVEVRLYRADVGHSLDDAAVTAGLEAGQRALALLDKSNQDRDEARRWAARLLALYSDCRREWVECLAVFSAAGRFKRTVQAIKDNLATKWPDFKLDHSAAAEKSSEVME